MRIDFDYDNIDELIDFKFIKNRLRNYELFYLCCYTLLKNICNKKASKSIMFLDAFLFL